MRFKVGDKVRVKEGLVGGNTYGDVYFGFGMEKYCGKCFVVEQIYGTNVYYLNEAKAWRFSGDMLEPIIPPEKLVIYRDGNKTIAKYYKGDKTVNVAIACVPEDEYSFEFESRLAMNKAIEKMMENVGYTLIKCVGYKTKSNFNFTVGKEYKIYDNGRITNDNGSTYTKMPTKAKMLEFLSQWYIFEEI